MHTFAFSFEDAQQPSWWKRVLDTLARLFARFKAFLSNLFTKGDSGNAAKADALLAEKLKDPKTKEEAVESLGRIVNRSEGTAYLVRRSIGTQESVLNKKIIDKLKLAVTLINPSKLASLTAEDVKKLALSTADMEHEVGKRGKTFKVADTGAKLAAKTKPFAHLDANKPWEAELKEIDSLNDKMAAFLGGSSKEADGVNAEMVKGLTVNIALLVGAAIDYATTVKNGIQAYNLIPEHFIATNGIAK